MEKYEEQNSDNDSYDEQLEQQENEIKEQLKNQRYETLIQINSQISKSQRKGKPVLQGKTKRFQGIEQGKIKQTEIDNKHKNKNAPVCRSAKIPVRKYERIVQPLRKIGRDPRFDELSGTLKIAKFYKNYNFLEQQKQTEISELNTALSTKQKKKYTDEEKSKLKLALSRNKNDMANFKSVQTKLKIQEEITEKNKQKVLAGQNPYYLKKNELQKEVFKEKFNQLNEEGKLDSYLNEKRKKKDIKLKQAYENMENFKKVKFN